MKLMKAILSIFFLTIFVGSTNGFQLYTHYCGDLLANISITNQSHCGDDDDGCETEQKMDCCEDHAHFIQLDVDLQTPKVLQANFDLPILSVEKFADFEVKESNSDSFSFNYNPPLLYYKIPIYKKLSRLTFYG